MLTVGFSIFPEEKARLGSGCWTEDLSRVRVQLVGERRPACIALFRGHGDGIGSAPSRARTRPATGAAEPLRLSCGDSADPLLVHPRSTASWRYLGLSGARDG